MENDSYISDDVSSFVREKVAEALNLPKETFSNSMTTSFVRFIRPNNYRRGIMVKSVSNSGIVKILTTIPSASQGKHNKIVNIPNFKGSGISLQLGKNKLVGIYSQIFSEGKKYWFRIERHSIDEINVAIEQKKVEIMNRIDSALSMFCEEFDLGFRFEKPFWVRSETAIHGDDYIDRIPRDLIVHDTIFKKVYKDDLEFKSGLNDEPIVCLKNYISNRAVESIAPDIARAIVDNGSRIDKLDATIDKLNSSIAWLDENIVSHKAWLERNLSAVDKQNTNLDNMNIVISKLDAHLSAAKGFGTSFPLARNDVGGVDSAVVHSVDDTLSISDVDSRSKKYRLFMARKFLREYGWGDSVW